MYHSEDIPVEFALACAAMVIIIFLIYKIGLKFWGNRRN